MAAIIYVSTRMRFYHACLLRVRFSVESFAVYNAEAVFGLFTMKNGLSKDYFAIRK